MNCATCQNWSPKSDKPMARFRLAPCLLGPRWEFKPPHGKCVNHKPVSAEIEQQRRAWIAKVET